MTIDASIIVGIALAAYVLLMVSIFVVRTVKIGGLAKWLRGEELLRFFDLALRILVVAILLGVIGMLVMINL